MPGAYDSPARPESGTSSEAVGGPAFGAFAEALGLLTSAS